MKDSIKIVGIKGFGFHGVFDAEAKNGQEFYVDVEIKLDLSAAAASDDLVQTIDYAAVTELVIQEIEGERCQLIERLAWRIANRVKAEHSRVEAVTITVHKPHAPVYATVKDISVTITQ